MSEPTKPTPVIEGLVISGQRLGGTLGFPTANIIADSFKAQNGVYIAKVEGLDKTHHGVANLGTRPTIGTSKRLLEVHILDLNEDIYGRRLRVTLLSRLRDETKFESLEALAEQIHCDIGRCRDYLAS